MRQFFFESLATQRMTRALLGKLQNTCYTLQRISQRFERYKISLPFLQLTTQFLVARQVGERGCYTRTCLATVFVVQVEKSCFV